MFNFFICISVFQTYLFQLAAKDNISIFYLNSSLHLFILFLYFILFQLYFKYQKHFHSFSFN